MYDVLGDVVCGGFAMPLRKGYANESENVRAAAEEMDTVLVAEIPRDPTIQVCESMNVTVIEGAPNSALSERYRMLANSITG